MTRTGLPSSGARQNQSVEQRDGDTHVNALAQRPEHATGRGPVQVNCVTLAAVTGGNDHRISFRHEADVTNQAFVENAIDRLAIVNGALGEPPNLGPCGRCEFTHGSLFESCCLGISGLGSIHRFGLKRGRSVRSGTGGMQDSGLSLAGLAAAPASSV